MSQHTSSKTAIWLCMGLFCSGIWFGMQPGSAYAFVPKGNFHQNAEKTSDHDNQEMAPSLFLRKKIINYQANELAVQRKQYLAAEQALRKRQLTKFRQLLSTLTEYPLYPYLRYQDLNRRLSKVDSEELSQFFTNYSGQPVVSQLRRKLLRLKARQGRWQEFLDHYTPQHNVRLQCQYLYALIRTGEAEAAFPQIQELWLTGRSRPRGCDRVFKHWRTADKLTPELVWQRMELALSGGRRTVARYLVRFLASQDQKLARLWIKLHRTPRSLPKYRQHFANSQHFMTPRIVMNLAKRMARHEPKQAADFWFGYTKKHPVKTETRYDMLQSLAIILARQHAPGAETWFSAIPEQYLSDTAREWRIRTALRQSQWQVALTAIEALPAEDQTKNRWRFWRARILEKLDQPVSAISTYTALAQQRSYYGFLAADQLDLPYAMSDRPHKPTAGELFVIAQQPGVRRARELFQLNRLVDARREWREATAQMGNLQRADASKLAQLWGWAEQSILTMASTDQRDDVKLRFPLLFQQEILAHSERQRIDPAWTYGVIRRESAFVQDARSPVGAIGLMQLMPATAKHLSRSLKVKYRSDLQLTQRDTNLRFGTNYLHRMLKRFDGQTVLATAAYNAGARRILKWLPNENNLDAELWIENIPFRETRDYVKSVLAFTVIYADRLGLDPQRLSELMPAIPSRTSLQQSRNI